LRCDIGNNRLRTSITIIRVTYVVEGFTSLGDFEAKVTISKGKWLVNRRAVNNLL
jgi:hypothetical protein